MIKALGQKWLKIRRDLYALVRQQVEERLGGNISGSKYELEYQKIFFKKWKISEASELVSRMQEAEVVYLADFHALVQSQKSHLRLLEKLSDEPLLLALECFYTKDQKHIDSYLEGKLTEQDFLRKIEWSKRWGFPWGHYKPLVLWAQRNGYGILALNIEEVQQERLSSLHRRDRHGAHLLMSAMKRSPKTKIAVVYGDLHLAEAHLPRQVEKLMKRPIDSVTVYQNSERIYFWLAQKSLESQVDVVSYSQRIFCLNSVPPWVKWQNYLLYLDQTEDMEIEGEETMDLTDQVGQYVKILAADFDFQADLRSLSVFSAEEPTLWKKLESHLSDRELKYYRLMIQNGYSFYLPQISLCFLARPSVNYAASLAATFLHFQMAGLSSWSFKGVEDFERLIWVQGVSYFGSKLVNPKRKSDTLLDIKNHLAAPVYKEKRAKEALRLALAQKMNELIFMAHRRKLKLNFRVRSPLSYLQASELLGGLLGERLYAGFHQKLISLSTLQGLLKKDWTHEDFRSTYLEIMDTLESIPLDFNSKNEKL